MSTKTSVKAPAAKPAMPSGKANTPAGKSAPAPAGKSAPAPSPAAKPRK